jgi:hypothetical protein
MSAKIILSFDDFQEPEDTQECAVGSFATWSRPLMVLLKTSISKIKRDAKAYKDDVQRRIQKHWLILRSPALARLLKSKGTVPQGTSKAKGLENAGNWNAELASIVRPDFQNWYVSHSENTKLLKDALPLQLDRLYQEMVFMMNKSQANLITV